MKRRYLSLLALVLTAALVLASCAAKMEASDNMTTVPGGAYDTVPEAPMEPQMPDASYDAAEDWTGGDSFGAVDSVAGAVRPQRSLQEKIIYSASVQIETVDFDAAVEGIQSLLDTYGAFLESSSVSGRSLSAARNGWQTYRHANFVIRVPVESFEAMKDSLDTVGSVLSADVYTDNITERYYDVQARVDSYEIEQQRLMDMLAKCETVSEMIEIESRLSDVRYQLESFESMLRNWQNQVDYSTITVNISEVEEYTKVAEPHRSYWQQIGDGLRETLEDLGDFFKDLFKGIVVNLPIILIIVVLAAVVIVIVVRSGRKRRARRAEAQRTAIDAGYRSAESGEDRDG